MTRIQVHLEKFTREWEFVVTRQGLTLAGITLPIGAPFPKDQITERRLRQLYDARYIGRAGGPVDEKKERPKIDYDGMIATAFEQANARLAAMSNIVLPPVETQEAVEEAPLTETVVEAGEPVSEPPPPEVEQPQYSDDDWEHPSGEEAIPEEKADYLGRQGAAKKRRRPAPRR